ncbi:MAG TPA: tRNA (guanosine(46)-N7)-methyltransferase TrmB, partial [Methylophaga aminisulfidivorans]|nr:tRNA (guanosine(46)-N7)-methyltransferase TrmB [Methylophaga aminisulfidivorans]
MTSDTHNRREIRSFVKREGRLTPGQQRALDNHWPEFGIEDDTDLSNLCLLYTS